MAYETDEYDDWSPIALEREWHIGKDGKIHYMVDPGDGLCSSLELDEPKIRQAIVDAWNAVDDGKIFEAAALTHARERRLMDAVCALEAENERLLSALRNEHDGSEADCPMCEIVRAALAGRKP